MLAGLQGSGKTTTAVKLALLARREGHRPLVVALDFRRPAAVEQLKTLAERQNVAFGKGEEAIAEAARLSCDVVILDTAGRLHIDAERMASRILGMGDMLTLIEKAERSIDQTKAAEVEKHLRAGQLSFDDFLSQIRQVRGMGSLEGMLDMVPGGGALKGQLAGADPE